MVSVERCGEKVKGILTDCGNILDWNIVGRGSGGVRNGDDVASDVVACCLGFVFLLLVLVTNPVLFF